MIYVVGGDVKLRWAMVECCLGTNMYSMAMMGGFYTRTVMGRQLWGGYDGGPMVEGLFLYQTGTADVVDVV
jgi:hypothetical protein